MKLTITTFKDDLFTLEVPADIELENLKAYCEVESGIPASEITLVWNGNPLSDNKKTVTQYGVADGDMLFLQSRPSSSGNRPGTSSMPPMDFSGIQLPGASTSSQAQRPRAPGQRNVDPYTLRELLLTSPHEVALLKQNNPPLADALLSNDPEKFAQVFRQQAEEKRKQDAEKMALFTGDPFDPEVQRKIAEAIQQENVNANMEAAMEFSPESFGQVHMLYIDCKVNGHHVKAFVDSGAQMTIMSKACAQRCNISHLLDTRWAGVAKGVGIQRILGRVHMCQISINNDHLQCSFSILEDQQMDMLLGLDMLKRHQCVIDLRKNLLVIGTTGTETAFLPESELPECARLNRSISTTEQDRDLAEAMLKSAEDAASASNRPPAVELPHGPTAVYPEHMIQSLVSNGFSRQQAQAELANAGGDVQKALMNLLAKSLTAPPKPK